MSAAAEKLHAALEELETAVQSQAAVDPQTRERLERAISDIRAALNNLPPDAPTAGSSSESEEDSLTGQLAGVAREFEATHPTLSGMVGSVIDALAQMGI